MSKIEDYLSIGYKIDPSTKKIIKTPPLIKKPDPVGHKKYITDIPEPRPAQTNNTLSTEESILILISFGILIVWVAAVITSIVSAINGTFSPAEDALTTLTVYLIGPFVTVLVCCGLKLSPIGCIIAGLGTLYWGIVIFATFDNGAPLWVAWSYFIDCAIVTCFTFIHSISLEW